MADNFIASPGSGGDTFRADDIAGVKIPSSKINLGADGTDDGFVSSANPLPTTGKVQNSSGTPIDPATSADITNVVNALLSTLSVAAAGTFPVSGPLTDTQLRATAVPVSGTIAVSGTVPVSAASLPLPTGAATAAKQPALGTAGTPSADVISVQGVSGGVAQPVSGTVTANAGTGTMAVSAASLPLPTGAATQTTLASVLTTLQAALPAGTNTIGAILNAMITRTTGTITANGQSVTCTLAGSGGGVIAYTGTFSGINGTFQASYDGGTNYISHVVAPIAGTGPISSLSGVSTSTAAFIFYCPGATHFRFNCSAFTSGTMSITINPLAVSSPGFIESRVAGFDASNVAATVNPILTAISARSTEPGANTNGTLVTPQGTQTGKAVVLPFAIANVTWTYAAAAGGLVTTSGVTVKAAGAAGIRNYITHIDVVNSHATIGTDIQIRDGASGTVLWRGWAQPAGGGVSADFNPPLRGTAATLVEIAEGTATGTTGVYCNLSGYQSVE